MTGIATVLCPLLKALRGFRDELKFGCLSRTILFFIICIHPFFIILIVVLLYEEKIQF